MPKTFYSNLFCTSLHYPVLYHLYNVVNELKEGDKLVLCFWDKRIFPFQTYGINLLKDDYGDLVKKIKSFLSYHKINYKVIYLSDAFFRLLKNEQASELLYAVLGRVSLDYIKENYDEEDVRFKSTTISKLTFAVADYLIALHLDKLFPELAIHKVTDYYAGRKFKILIPKIEEAIFEKSLILGHPRVVYEPKIPILNYSSGKIISVGMSKNEIEREIEKAYEKGTIVADTSDILLRISGLLNKNKMILSKNTKYEETTIDYITEVLPELSRNDLIVTLTENLYNWLEIIKTQILDAQETSLKKVNYIKNKEDLKKILSFLNPQKMEIIKLCNGERTIDEIAKLSSLRESSTRSYLSRLRAKEIITKDERPRRKIDEIFISFD
ncbi:MAG: hypothetical protein PHT54_03855 [Candidatus Nanoarchaeia archaeon]|nr:hypothetical protein [Candidatus Nanoarchaeia archaeon]